MRMRIFSVLCLGACLILIACPARQSASGPDKAAALRDRIDFLSALSGQRNLATRVLEEMSGALPDNTRLTEVTYDASGVRAKGYAPSNTVLADYVSKLGESPILTNVNLQSSVQRRIRNRDYQEFSVQAGVKGAGGVEPSAFGAGPDSDAVAALTAHLTELEKSIPTAKDSAGILRQFQQAADDSGMKITKFTPGGEIPGKFYGEWSISIEATGSRQSLSSFLAWVSELPGLWVIKKFSMSAVSPQDDRSSIRASLAAQTCIKINN
jgi:hypothetical protein